MQTFISKGKSVKAAIETGLVSLNLAVHQVKIEIIQIEKKGILGMGNKDAIVKLTYETQEQPKTPNPVVSGTDPETDKELAGMDIEELLSYLDQQTEESNEQTKDEMPLPSEEDVETHQQFEHDSLKGKVWVKNGELFVRDSDRHNPSIRLSKGVKIKKNNALLDESFVFVTEKDKLEVDLNEHIEPTDWRIREKNQGLIAELHIRPGYKRSLKLKDKPPAFQVTLETIEEKVFYQTVAEKDIYDALFAEGIDYGIDEETISLALSDKQGGVFEIAVGDFPEEGKDGKIEKKVSTTTVDDKKDNDDLAAVDFRERKKIPTVEKGQIIAIVHPPVPGKAGKNIRGEVLEPKQVREIKLLTQKGTILLEDRVISNENGRPYIDQKGLFVKTKVLPQMVHEGNVDLESGNINFRGDIEVKGDVTEGMKIQSGGTINIHQTVNGAMIKAQHSIIIGGSANASTVSAGTHVDIELLHLLRSIYEKTNAIGKLLEQIIYSSEFKSSPYKDRSIASLILLLKEKRFPTIINEIKNFNRLVKKEQAFLIDPEWEKVSVALTHIFFKIPQIDIAYIDYKNLIDQMQALIELSVMQSHDEAELTMKNALNSRLVCSGDVTITGRSCFNTTIEAEGFVKVRGVLRGGKVTADRGCDINEVGGALGVRTFINVPDKYRIKIGKVYEGTVIKIGNFQHTFERDEIGVYARLNEKDKLVLY